MDEAFLQDLKDGRDATLLVKIKANSSTTFTARFDIKNMAASAADALKVCPELKAEK